MNSPPSSSNLPISIPPTSSTSTSTSTSTSPISIPSNQPSLPIHPSSSSSTPLPISFPPSSSSSSSSSQSLSTSPSQNLDSAEEVVPIPTAHQLPPSSSNGMLLHPPPPPPTLSGSAPLAPAPSGTMRSFPMPGPPLQQQPLHHQHQQQIPPKNITPNYTIRKTTRPVVPYSAAPSSVTPATPAPPTTTNVTTTNNSNSVPIFPALHLTPLNDTFNPKQISLYPIGSKIKIGRQTNAKTVPNGTNGYFDSKVLSRMHAEVWSEDGKVFIKDVKSSNGTFINGERLSAEAAESDIFELHTDDTVEFGIDIVSDDTKTIVHHKVAAKVFLVMNGDDALASSREFDTWYRTVGENSSQIQRRSVKPAGPPGGNNGLSFDHVLSRLQGEIQKSRDTSSHLGDLSSALNDVHDTLGGGVPPPPSFAHSSRIPPYIPNGARDAQAQSIAALQSQLNETQASLAGHVGKIRDLEGLLAEHDVIKREVGTLRKQMEDAQRDMETILRGRNNETQTHPSSSRDGRESPIATLLEAEEAAEDDDDARSISSVDTIRLNTAEQLATISAHTISSSRPNGIVSSPLSNGSSLPLSSSSSEISTPVAKGDDGARDRLIQEQAARLATLTVELEEANRLGQTLRSQHAEASATMHALEARLQGLEKAVEGRVAEAEGKVYQEVESRWNGWRTAFEESWRQEREKERESWQSERDKLVAAVREWEERKKADLLESSDWSSSGDEDEEDGERVSSPNREVVSSSPPSSLPSGSRGPKGKRPRSRRRRRSNASRVSTLALAAGGVASDSDSTVGDPSRLGPADGAWSGPQRGVPLGGSKGGFDDGSRPYGAASHVPIVAAGAVVLIGVATAYAWAIKMKE